MLIIIFFVDISFRSHSLSLCVCSRVRVRVIVQVQFSVYVYLCSTFFVLKHSKHLFSEKKNRKSVFSLMLKSEFLLSRYFRISSTTFLSLYAFQSTTLNLASFSSLVRCRWWQIHRTAYPSGYINWLMFILFNPWVFLLTMKNDSNQNQVRQDFE